VGDRKAFGCGVVLIAFPTEGIVVDFLWSRPLNAFVTEKVEEELEFIDIPRMLLSTSMSLIRISFTRAGLACSSIDAVKSDTRDSFDLGTRTRFTGGRTVDLNASRANLLAPRRLFVAVWSSEFEWLSTFSFLTIIAFELLHTLL
jgi:hypothetical protein